MLKRFRHILMLAIMLSSAFQVLAQNAMPDKVCVGTTRHYRVTGSPGSVFSWKIDGVIQSSASNVLEMTWTTTGTYTVEVQEHDLNNCNGDIKSGTVTVVNVPTVLSQTTNDTTPLITGTASVTAGETFTVTVDGVTYTAGDGKLSLTGTNWNVQIPAGNEISDGTYPVTALVTDGSGTLCPDNTTNELIIDATAPVVPTVVSQATSDTTPTITGTATVAAGETLTVTVNGVTYVAGDGNLTLTGTSWTLQIPTGSEMANGTYPVTATVTDPANNTSTDVSAGELILDTIAPVVPTVVSQTTKDTTPTITGTATVAAGETLTVTVNGVTYTVGDGNLTLTGTSWTLQIPTGSEMASGTYTVTATVTDPANNTSTDVSAGELILDTIAPVIPTVVSQTTNDTTPTITGTATVAAGETLTVTVNGVTYTVGDGNLTLTGTSWTLQIPAGSEMANGTYPVTATVTDPANNTSTDVSAGELIIDTIAPVIPTVVSQTTKDTTPTITGTATVAAGETLTVTVNGVTYTVGDGNLSLTGTSWTLQIPAGSEMASGTYTVTATVTDPASNTSTDVSAGELTIDTIAPVIPTVVSQTTNDTTPTITGTATVAAGETLTVSVNGVIYTVGDGNLSLTGTSWTLQVPTGSELASGTYPVTATITDPANNTSTDVSAGELIIDTIAPVVPTVVSQTTKDTTPTITGTATVAPGETLTVTVNGVTYTIGDGNLSLTGTSWTLQIPAGSEMASGTYTVTATVTDPANNTSTDVSAGELILDTIAPVIPTVVSQTTNDTTPTITGTATVAAGETLTVSVNGVIYTVGDGNLTLTGTSWTLQIPTGSEMANGTWAVTATVTDPASNTSTDVSAGELIIDTIAPVVPTVVSQTTKDTTPTITGTATVAPGETLTVTVNGVTYTIGDGSLTLTGTSWTLQIPTDSEMANGTWPVTATVTDPANNTSTDVSVGELTIDTIAPVIPTVVSQNTNDTTPSITGTATVAAGEVLTVTVNGITYTNGDGKLSLTGTTWTLQIPTVNEILEGTYPVTATLTDLAGNSSTDITTSELIIDTTSPAIPTVVSQITKDTTPVITGTAIVGVGKTLTVAVNGVTYTEGDGKLTVTGTDWSLQIPAGNEILEGTYPVTAILTDLAGNSSTDITTNELIIDTTSPAIPTVVSQITKDTTPVITGTAIVGVGKTLTVAVNGVTYTEGDGKLSVTGTDWSLQIPAGNEILEGTYPVTAILTDLAGNSSTDITTNELIIDTTSPAIPTVVSQITNDTTPVITGTAIVGVGKTLTVAVNGVSYTEGDGKLSVTGTDWSLQIPAGSEILEGTYPVTAILTDLAGNSSTDITTNELIIDTTSPAIPTVVSQITNDTTPVITGTAIVGVGKTLTVAVNGVTYTEGDGKLSVTGTDWSLQIPAGNEILEGTYPVTATLTDLAGNSSTDISTNELIIDTTSPAIPTVVSQITKDTTPTITGTATVAAGETLTVTVNGVTYTVGDGNLTLTGTSWTLQVPTGSELASGTYAVTATVTDQASNTSTDVSAGELTIDTIAPVVPTVVSQTTKDTTPTITGTATVAAGETLTVTVNGVTYTVGDGNLTLTGTSWALQIPTGSEMASGTYTVTATVTDPASNTSTDVSAGELILDTIAPVVPTVVSQTTNDTTPTITGTATVAAGETLTVTVNGVTYTVGDGNLTLTGTSWTLQIPTGSEIANGTYAVTATVTDPANNTSTDVSAGELTIDTLAPVIPTVVSQTTKDTTPTITGTATVAAGETLTVTVNGVTYTVGDGNLSLTGTSWILQIPTGSEMASGTYPVTATVTDPANNTSTDVSAGELILDTIAPVVPTVVSQTTKDTTPTITGTATVAAGETLTVIVNGVTYTVGDGNLSLTGTSWTLQIPTGSEMASGTYAVTATVTDPASNTSTDVSAGELTIDTIAPVIPTVVSQTTKDTTPTITGTATVAAGETLTVTVNGVTYTVGDGNLSLTGTSWTLQIPTGSELASGTYTVTATVTDPASNTSTDVSAGELTIDTIVPVIPTVVSQTTKDTTPTITGTATVAAGETLTVTVNGVTYTVGDGNLSLTGTSWTLQIPTGSEMASGTYTVTATVTDPASNTSTDVSAGELILDTIAPVIPTVVSQTTKDTTPTITGTATVAAGETLTVTVNGVTYTVGDGNLTLTGTSWTLQIPAGSEMASGTYPVTATVTDPASNTSTDVSAGELTIDTIAPVIPTVVSQTTNDTTPTITGTATVAAGETLTVTVNGVTYTVGDGNLTLTGTSWTLQVPTGSELANGTYAVTATVTDPANNTSTDVSAGELILDTIAPVIPTVVSQTTKDTTPVITGTATVAAGETLTVTVNGVTYTVGDGNLTLTGTSWTLQIPTGSEMASGTYPVTATVTDQASNTSTDVSAGELTIDTIAPVVPTVVSQTTKDTTPTITGTATVAAGETLTVTVNGVTYTVGDGNLSLTGTSWTLQIPTGSEMVSGTYPVTATITDPANNTSTDVSAGELIIDTLAPVVPTVESQTTKDTTPTITGTATVAAGETLTVTVNGVTYTVGDGNLSLTGTSWTLQIPTGSEMANGTWAVTATVTDPASNTSTDVSAGELTIDTIAPVIPTVVSQTTKDTTPTITGTATVAAGETLTVTVNGVTYTVGDGNLSITGTSWTLQIPTGSEMANGTFAVTATVTDPASNTSTDVSAGELTIDTIAPVVPTVVSQTTKDTTPTITGTATVAAGETLTVTVNGVTYTVGDGNLSLTGTSWTLQIPTGSEMASGTYTVTATVTDPASNTSTDVSEGELTIDTIVPVIPTVVSQTTKDTTPTITGTATVAAGETLTVSVNGVTYTVGDGNLSLTGTSWTLQIPAGSEIAQGSYPITARVTDIAGNSSTDLTTNELIIDTTPQVVPTVASQTTNDTTPAITGTATVAAGMTLTVTVNGATYTNGDGKLSLTGTTWTLQIPSGNEITDGTYPVTATVADLAGNVSTDLTTNELVIDTIAPMVPAVASQITDDPTPILGGIAVLAAGETLEVSVNGVTYKSGDGNLSSNGTGWSLQIPSGNVMPDGMYPVLARVRDLAGNFSDDITTNELVIKTNMPPLAMDDAFSTSGPAITGSMATNDSDAEGSGLLYRTMPLTAPVKGDVVINSNGTFTYTPKATAFGTDQFVYEVCDNGTPFRCSMARVVITFNNQKPLAVNDAYSAEQGTVISGRMNLNDADPNGNALSYLTTAIVKPAHGTVVIHADGTFDYTPAADYIGNDSYTYEVCDNGIPSQCARAVVSLELTKLVPVNRAPRAVNDINDTQVNRAVSGNVLTNDYDPDGNELTLTIKPVIQPSHGKVVILANGNYTYTPAAGFVGEDFFTYSVCDKNTSPALCAEANVNIEVSDLIAGNRAPVANEDEANTTEGKTVKINVLVNDFDPDLNPIHISRIPSTVSHGTLVQNPDGTFSYTPGAGFKGTDQFVYEICDNQDPLACSMATVTIFVSGPLKVNSPPFAADDAYFTSGVAISGNMGLNDTDVDGNRLVYETSPVVAPAKGTLSISSGGQFIYTPDADFEDGSDQFIYQVCDDAYPSACSKATVYISLIRNKKPALTDDLATTIGNKAVSGNLLVNDSDPDGDKLILKLSPFSGPANGTIVLKADGSYTYTPKAGFSGQDQIVYEVCDDGSTPICAQAMLTVTVEKEEPEIADRMATNDVNITFKNTPVSGNVLINDAGFYGFNATVVLNSEPVNGTVSMNRAGLYTYSPKADFTGIDNFYYAVCTADDPADCDTVNVTVHVLPDVLSLIPPVASDDEMQTQVNTAVSGNVLSNDLSVSGEKLILNTKTKDGPKSGTLVLTVDGRFVYTPNTGFTGQDYFVYEICGTVSGLCVQARVTITVSTDPIEVRLFAADDVFFSYGKTVQGNLLANDAYPSASTLSVNRTPLIQPLNGTVLISSNGTFSYTPAAGFVGTDQFVYEICDKQLNECDKATVFIVVKEAPALFADLAIQKTGPASVSVGETVQYRLTVTNHGTALATKVQIDDYMPVAIQNPTYQLEESKSSKAWSGFYELDQLEVNKTFILTISGTVSANAPDTLKNLATVSSLTWDPKSDNNISVVRTVVRRGPLARIAGAPSLTVGICSVQGIVLDAGTSLGSGLTYRWTPTVYLDNASAAKPVFHPGKTTRYHLTITDSNGQQDTASVLVRVPEAPKVVTDRNVFVDVPNKTIILNGSKSTGAGPGFLWLSKEGIILSGETTSTAQVSGLGMYYLQVTDSLGCISKDSVNVGLYIQAENDTTETNVNESVVINVVRNDKPANAINPSSISIVTPPLHGIATVSADSLILYLPEDSYIGQDEFVYAICDYFKNCDNAKVLVIINDVPFFIPEAFSPNGDGINDKFEMKGLEKYRTVEIEIFNRWGNVVYQSKNYGEGVGKSGYWDGTAQFGIRVGSGPVPTGTYYYIMKLNGKENINGSIYLDR